MYGIFEAPISDRLADISLARECRLANPDSMGEKQIPYFYGRCCRFTSQESVLERKDL